MHPVGQQRDDLLMVVTAPRRSVFAFAPILLLHLAGGGLLLLGLDGSTLAVLAGAAAFAYTRGLIHAADFDHISVIDNSLRKFVAEGKRPTTVGLAFAAGHSTVVILAGLLVAAGTRLGGTLLDEGSTAAATLGVVGLSVSGAYLLLLAVNNTAVFASTWRLHRRLRVDPHTPVSAEALHPSGPAARLLTRPLSRVRRPRHIYAIGFLFGLGFDTASTIGLLMTAAAAAAAGVSPVALLALPVLFAAAMTLGDTLNSLLMLRIYTAAQTEPRHRLIYNLVVTGIGILSAFSVAVLAASALLTDHGITFSVLHQLAAIDTTFAGYALVGIFSAAGAVAWWRRRGAQ